MVRENRIHGTRESFRSHCSHALYQGTTLVGPLVE